MLTTILHSHLFVFVVAVVVGVVSDGGGVVVVVGGGGGVVTIVGGVGVVVGCDASSPSYI